MLKRSQTVMVTGASGFVGKHLIAAMRAKTMPVVSVAGRSETFDLHCDLSQNFDLTAALSGVNCVVHLAAKAHVRATNENRGDLYQINAEAPVLLAKQAAAAGVQRFVFLSSIGVSGDRNRDGKAFTGNESPRPVTDYARSKLSAEEALKVVASDTGLELVIVRPALVYGPETKGNFLRLLWLVSLGLPLPLACLSNKRSFIGIDNLVNLLLKCIQHPSAPGHTFVAADDESLSTPELFQVLARGMGRSSCLLPTPVAWLRLLARLLGRQKEVEQLVGCLEIDNTQTKTILGWSPTLTAQEGLTATAQWYAENK